MKSQYPPHLEWILSKLRLRTFLRGLCFNLLLLCSFNATAAFSVTNGQDADGVLGQSDFTSNSTGTSASSMENPRGVAIDPSTGKVFVADDDNNRVLRFSATDAFINGSPAEAVLGQSDLTSGSSATTQSGMNGPRGLLVDNNGRLWVADGGNNRVLRFDNAATKTNGANADGVLGQADFISDTANTTQNAMDNPKSFAIDNNGTLWVVDNDNHRVLHFDNAATKTNGANADGVLGQADFTSSGSATTQAGMNAPYGVTVDSNGTLWVADNDNHRVLRFDNAATKANGGNADGVLGQIDFTSSDSVTSQAGMDNPKGVTVDAAGRLYVLDDDNYRVTIFENAASKTNGDNADFLLGQADFTSGSSNRSGSVAANTMDFGSNPGIFFDNLKGNLWVADEDNNRVLRFDLGTPEINVKANNTDIADGSTTLSVSDHTDFGSIDISSGTVQRIFTIENIEAIAGLNLTGSSNKVVLSGTHASDFTVTEDALANPITIHNSQSFTITFDPSATGLRTATVSLANDDPDENPYDFAIQGTGTAAPEMDVEGNSTSIADGDTTPNTNDDTDFADVIVGNNTTKTFTIQNTGSAELNLTASPIVTVTGNGFSVTTQPTSPVAITTGETTFIVQFSAPTTVGVITGEISIANDDSDENPYNFNITANAVNDTPVISDIADQTTNEDTATAAIDFTISDVVTAVGDLTLTGRSSNTALVSDANIVFGGSNGNRTVTVTPLANQSGSATITVTVSDGILTATDTFELTVNAVNDTPTTSDKTITLNEDATYTFTETDFEFSDIDTGNSLTQIKIMQLPSVGTLQLDGVDVTIDQVIVAADIGKLTFTPAANANGSNYATFQFKVHDGTSYSDADFTMTIDVTAVSDTPTAADNTVTLNEDEAYTFAEADFEFSDVDSGNSLNQIKITQLPTIGTLQLDGVDVTIDQVIVAADIGKLTFTPAANANGSNYATFQFKVHDGTSYSDADFTMSIDVTAVNDAPSFTKGDDQTVFVNAEQNITAWATNIDFGSANESSQTLNFIVTNDNNSLFSVQPAIDTSGNLTFIPSTVGSAVVTVILSDGIDTSAAQSFNIKVDPLPSSSPTQQPTGCTLSSNVNCAIKNEGTITDVKIEPEGSIEGGTLEGEIKNEGTLTDVTLAAGTNIDGGQIQGKVNGNPEAPAILINVKIIAKTELSNVILDKTVELPNDVTLTNIELRGSSVNGGKLEGTIRTTSSATVIKNVSLGENATIIGGKLAGTISGTPNKPAILEHLTIEPQTLLTDVTISDGVEMPADVNLASGVRFTTTENIPTDVDLTETLPKKGQSIDLSADPVIGGEGILPAINRLSEFVPAELTVLQHDKGFIYLDIEGIRYAVNPIKVKHLSEAERLQLESGQTVRFKTDTQIDVLAPPAIQDISSFKETLIKINLPTVNINNDGNIKVLVTEKVWYSGRPDLASTTVDKDTPNGFITKEDGNVALIFEDEKGEKREQILYPSPANMSALGKFDLTPKGILEFEINGQKFKGRLDYQVKQGIKLETRHALSLTEIPDSNGDFMIIYPDGAEQRLFALPE